MLKYLLIAFLSTQALAFPYLPYELKTIPPAHQIPSNFSTALNVPQETFSPLDLTDVGISLFSDVTSILEDYRLGIVRPATFTFSQCDEIQQMPNTCEGSNAAPLEKLVRPVCRPESFMDWQDLNRSYDSKQLKTLAGSLQVLMSPLRDQSLSPALLPPQLINQARLILAKLDLANFRKGQAGALKLIQTIRKQGCASNKLTQMEAELTRILAQVEASATLVKAQKRAQKKMVNNSNNYCRNGLPYPALSDEERILLSTYVGALAWRARGGALWEAGTQARRKDFAGKVFEHLIVLNSNDQALGKKHGDAMAQRLQLKGWSRWFDMGRTDDDEISDLLGMTIRGLYQIGIGSYGPIAGASALKAFDDKGYDSSLYKAVGLQMGACYLYASRFLEFRPEADTLSSPRAAFTHPENHTAWGELCYGAVMGQGLARMLLAGHSCR